MHAEIMLNTGLETKEGKKEPKGTNRGGKTEPKTYNTKA